MIKHIIRLSIFGCIIIYVFPDFLPTVAGSLGRMVGEFFGQMSVSYLAEVKEGVTPEWLAKLLQK